MSFEGAVRINGSPIEELGFSVCYPGMRVSAPEPIVKFQRMPGGSVAIDTTLRDEDGNAPLKERTVTLTMCTIGHVEDIARMQANLAALTGSLMTIQCGNAPTWRGYAVFKNWQPVFAFGNTAKYKCDLVLTAEPFAYGAPATVSISGDVHITVDGDRPCWPHFKLKATSDEVIINCSSSSKLLTFEGLSDGATLEIESTPQARVARVNRTVVVPTLQSDFFPLIPGIVDLSITGASGVMSFTPLFVYGV